MFCYQILFLNILQIITVLFRWKMIDRVESAFEADIEQRMCFILF